MSDDTERMQIEKFLPRIMLAMERELFGKTTDTYSIRKTTVLAASVDSAQYYSNEMTKAVAFESKFDLLRDAMRRRQVDGLVLEFGVASGSTINHIASLTEQRVYGFDTFSGLPEDWRPGFSRGAFSVPEVPQVRSNVHLITGTFEQTLPAFAEQHTGPVSLVHVDCDLYSSTKTIFRNLAPRIVEGTIIVFDEYFNYPGWRQHEYKAFQEFVNAFQVTYEYISFVDSHQQVGVRVTGSDNSKPLVAARQMVVQDQLLAGLIENCSFSFTRTNGFVLSESVRLLPGGLISGCSHPNESAWAIDGDSLIFIGSRGQPTTVFDKIDRAKNGALTLLGRFVGDGGNEYLHRLMAAAPPVREYASVVTASPLNPQCNAEVAVLVRTYQCNAKYQSLMTKLNTNRSGFDLYAVVDETHARNDPGEWTAIWHSAAACGQLGLTQNHPELLRLCGDFPLYFALREIPSYKHYIMIEDDVELREPDASFLVELCDVLSDSKRPEVDFAGIQFQPDPNLIWGPASARVYTQRYCYLARFPFVIVSRRLCAYLFSQRQLEAARCPPGQDVMHCEVFVASAAMAAGFACCNLNELIPGCYDQSMMMMEIPGYGRPMGAGFEGRDGIRMYHPVYAAEEWLSRTRRVFSGTPWGHELQLRAVEGLVRDEAHARETGDVVMADAIDQLRDLLDPKWQEYFGTRPGQA